MAALRSLGHSHVWIVLICSLNTVSLTEVKVYIGDVALLPCVHTTPPSGAVTIYWRDKDNNNVLDIRRSVPDLTKQSKKFNGRVKSFPDLYMKGNFSISLQNVEQGDAGVYECNIRVPSESQRSVELIVEGRRRAEEQMNPPGPAGGAAAVTSASAQLLLLSAGLSVSLRSFI